MPTDTIDPVVFLGPQGPIARELPGYEVRPQQIAMAGAISEALAQSSHLIAEAGTGVGKSFAYLVPALKHVVDNHKKVVISTYTISLQEQLLNKDIPFIKAVSGIDFKAVLVKGRGNYFCWRRFHQAQRKGLTLFDNPAQLNSLEDIYHWALETQDGSISDLSTSPPMAVWEMICCETASCMGKRCDQYNNCFYQRTRNSLFSADILIANHAMLFSDLAAKMAGAAILPHFDVAVLDEAHNIENVAGKHFGLRLTNTRVSFLLSRIYNPRTEKGIMAGHVDNDLVRLVDNATSSAEIFFDEMHNYNEKQEALGANSRVTQPNTFVNTLSKPLADLGTYMRSIAMSLPDEQDAIEINSFADRCLALADEAHLFVTQGLPETVYWIESSRRRYRPIIAASASPLHVGPTLKKALFDPYTVILTSATLSIRHKHTNTAHNHNSSDGFSFFASRLGLKDYRDILLDSPFDYKNQISVYIEKELPEPTRNNPDFLPAAAKAIIKYLRQTQGKAFVLFTSFKQLDAAAKDVQEFCDEHNLLLLTQGKGKNRSDLLDEFRDNINSVLFGTDSFWQGVDVPGRSLSNVIIVKLPFDVPDHPLLQARLEQIKREGGNPFFDHQLPKAILKFKQGIGRLIRSKTDKGIVVILDPRVVTKRYGHAFLKALPTCQVNIVTNNYMTPTTM